MFLLDWFPRTLLYIFFVLSMFSIGLQTTPAEIRSLLTSRALIVQLLLANFVVIPLIGVLMVMTIPFERAAATAFLLLAFTPGGISSLQFTTKIKGEALFAGSSAFIMSLLALFISPVLIELVHPGDITVTLPHGRVIVFLALFMLLPLAAGMWVCNSREHIAEKLIKPCATIGTAAFVGMMVLTGGLRKEAFQAVGQTALFSMLIFIIISMIVGWYMGGPARHTRPVVATVTSMRNIAVCALIAVNTFPDRAVLHALVAFAALMIPMNMVFTLTTLFRFKKEDKADKASLGHKRSAHRHP